MDHREKLETLLGDGFDLPIPIEYEIRGVDVSADMIWDVIIECIEEESFNGFLNIRISVDGKNPIISQAIQHISKILHAKNYKCDTKYIASKTHHASELTEYAFHIVITPNVSGWSIKS
ncbi:hypothetical protein KKA14_13270 [bacterium]|nr:hypothetical protein [bacterium]